MKMPPRCCPNARPLHAQLRILRGRAPMRRCESSDSIASKRVSGSPAPLRNCSCRHSKGVIVVSTDLGGGMEQVGDGTPITRTDLVGRRGHSKVCRRANGLFASPSRDPDCTRRAPWTPTQTLSIVGFLASAAAWRFAFSERHCLRARVGPVPLAQNLTQRFNLPPHSASRPGTKVTAGSVWVRI
jgi:hypothetical protein